MFNKIKEKIAQNRIIFSGMLIVSAGSIVSNFLNYYFNFYIQSLFPDFSTYGNFAFLITIVTLSTTIPLAISGSLTLVVTELNVGKEYSKLTNLYIKMLVLFSLIGFFIGLLIFSLSEVLNSTFNVGNVYYLQVLSLIIFFSISTIPTGSFLLGMLRFKSASILGVFLPFLKIILVTFFYIQGFGFTSILYSLLGISVANFLVGNFLLLKNYDQEFKAATVNEYIRRVMLISIPILFISIGNSLINQVDLLIIKANLSEEIAGKYGYLTNIGKIYFFGSLLFTGAMAPQITDAYKQNKAYFNLMLFYLKIVGFIVSVGLIVFSVFTKQFLDSFVFLSSYIGLNVDSLKYYYQVSEFIPVYSIFIALCIFINFFVLFLVAISKVKIFIVFLISILFQTALITNFGRDIYSVVYCNIFIASLLLIYLIFEVYNNYVDINNRSRL